MGHRQKQHMGRSTEDDRELPGRDVAADDREAIETKATRRGAPDETGKKPSTGKGGALSAE